jgi:hypothetical protein
MYQVAEIEVNNIPRLAITLDEYPDVQFVLGAIEFKECDDLDCIENFETLINAISNGLLTSSGELYIHYKKSNKK